MVNKRIELTNNWIVEVDAAENMSEDKILRIFAFFGHGIYMPIDTSEFTQEQWRLLRIEINKMGVK